jgi:hypothetical protein
MGGRAFVEFRPKQPRKSRQKLSGFSRHYLRKIGQQAFGGDSLEEKLMA